MSFMTRHEITARRYDATTAELWVARSFTMGPADWHGAARSLAGTVPAEIRVCPAALRSLSPDEMVAASALRDAGIGLALSGAGRFEHLRWLRMLPWSAVIAHPALLRSGADPDGARVIESWADAAARRDIHFVAPVADTPELPFLRAAGFTHAEVSAP